MGSQKARSPKYPASSAARIWTSGFYSRYIEISLVRSVGTKMCLCSILKIVRTHFAACGGEEAPTKNERLRREPDNFKFSLAD
ncbi:MAG: hypothetical protein A2758_03210 [Candidatus Zambryskibacteria bacterium RIFCSPHIGHO2_01_FULL_49_18]|uniref:Uncharacterized protein n=1 Tax=Candidatus Zambryskibacteria bacterium RIFCSPHIGHO2_01_FULL_49_18 TaxID=1802740 RepID=A0A1G2T371_9BACT|nr:MAG: hypothetical protein A2758_03210 [Candidatus Zambryskibacteria bacterium RIFCSPHIGHO2_01_FULL_49_18]